MENLHLKNQVMKQNIMPAISPQFAEFLVKTTMEADIQQALNTVLREYLVLKLRDLKDRCACFEKKWQMNFENFRENIRKNSLKKDIYSFEAEQDFREWEEAETLKNHYADIFEQ
ncbi:MAG: hypothetical protein R2941_15820 [Desulfobacterales bacterium]